MAIATDPPVSEAQRRAMYAAAEGRSKLGIARSVGREFIGKDMARSDWGLLKRLIARWLGEEEAEDAVKLSKVEVDYGPGKGEAQCRNCVHFRAPGTCEIVAGEIDPEGWCKRFAAIAGDEFVDAKHPRDLDGKFVKKTDSEDESAALSERDREAIGRVGSKKREEMPAHVFLEPESRKYPVKEKRDGEWKFDRKLLLAAAREARMHGRDDIARRADAIREREFGGASDMALDRGSVREKDADGRLHVERANISKANVCEYFGREIPDAEALGLDPDRRYRLLRDPEELRKAAPTFNKIPILSEHQPVTAEAHRPELVIGTTGSEARFEYPYLVNSLAFWPQEAIDDIESDAKRQLSCAYRYRADMTPGTYEGEPYDGVMRDIVGNHVALVPEGRAGPDVMVGDSKRSDDGMTQRTKLSPTALLAKGAILAALRPRLAQDRRVDVTPLLVGVTATNFAERKAALAAGLAELIKGKLAADAKVADVTGALDALALDELDDNSAMPNAKEDDDEEREERERAAEDARRRLGRDETDEERDMRERAEDARRRLGRDETEEERQTREAYDRMVRDIRARDARRRLGRDETEEERRKREAEDRAADRRDARDAMRRAKDEPPAFSGQPKTGVTKEAMDSAIRRAVADERRRNIETREAERFVRPWVGDMAMAHDSAEAVYRAALGALGIKHEAIREAAALKALIELCPKPGARKDVAVVAMDAADAKGFAERYPDASRIATL